MTSLNRSVRADTKNMAESAKSHFGNESIRGASAPREKLMSVPTWWSATRSADCKNDPDAGWVYATDSNISWHESAKRVELTDDAILAPLEAQFGQVRSRQRVRELAEVFTHQREVDAMLDMIPHAFSELDVTFLEPTCGSGNFLVEILRRKLQLVRKADCVTQEHYEHRLLRALASIYGVDISMDNVTEARARMAHTVLGHYQSDANTVEPTTGFLKAAALILGDNIVLGDSLDNADEIELCEWRPYSAGRFQRIWSCALVPEHARSLFWQERVQDVEPIHYSELVAAATPPKTKSRTRTKK